MRRSDRFLRQRDRPGIVRRCWPTARRADLARYGIEHRPPERQAAVQDRAKRTVWRRENACVCGVRGSARRRAESCSWRRCRPGAKGTGLVFVSNEKGDTITVLDGKTDSVVRTIDTCGRPRDMEWNQDQTLIYVACADDNVIGIVDVAQVRDRRRDPLHRRARGIRDRLAAQRYIYVSNEEDAALTVDRHAGPARSLP